MEVALLTEGVDRNICVAFDFSLDVDVALLTEGVDRNTTKCCHMLGGFGSPSSRRAWIEIDQGAAVRLKGHQVALLTEGVDRNAQCAGGGAR